MSSAERTITRLQQKITQAKQELDEIRKLEQPMPELINTTNMLRTNEYYAKANEKQSKLLITYEEYIKELEKIVLSTSIIKTKIKSLKSRSKPRKTTKKKTKRKKRTTRKKKTRKKSKTRRRRKIRKKRR